MTGNVHSEMSIKKEILKICRQKLLDSIDDLEANMRDLQQQANEYGQPKDRYDPFKTQLLRRKDMLAQQLVKELNELKLLDKMDSLPASEVIGFGSLILTDDLMYFTGIGLGKIETAAGSVYTLSMQVPITIALMKKKKGDMVVFRDKKINILDVQ